MNLIHKKTDYAIQALCYMAKEGRKVSALKLTKELKIAYPVLRSVLQSLTRRGILRSEKGKNGGFALALPPKKILLGPVIHLFQGDMELTRCVIGKEPCRNVETCIVRKRVRRVERYAEKEFKSLTIAALTQGHIG